MEIHNWFRRSPHGERGLKCRINQDIVPTSPGRSPHGERGLKLEALNEEYPFDGVAPPTGSVDRN